MDLETDILVLVLFGSQDQFKKQGRTLYKILELDIPRFDKVIYETSLDTFASILEENIQV